LSQALRNAHRWRYDWPQMPGISEAREDAEGEMIEITDIAKVYRMGDNEIRALDGVSLSVQEGEWVARKCRASLRQERMRRVR